MPAGPLRLKPRTSVVTSAEADLLFCGPTEVLEDKLRVAEGHLARMWEEGAHEQSQESEKDPARPKDAALNLSVT